MNRHYRMLSHPCTDGPHAPGLFTYYVIMALVVVIMTISIIWLPFVQLMGEFNNLIVKLILFLNRELLGNHFPRFFNSVEEYFLSQPALVMMALFLVTYMLYLASWDLLAFTGCYISTLPNYKFLKKMKKKALKIIERLLCVSVKKRCVKFNKKVKLMYYNPSRNSRTRGTEIPTE